MPPNYYFNSKNSLPTGITINESLPDPGKHPNSKVRLAIILPVSRRKVFHVYRKVEATILGRICQCWVFIGEEEYRDGDDFTNK